MAFHTYVNRDVPTSPTAQVVRWVSLVSGPPCSNRATLACPQSGRGLESRLLLMESARGKARNTGAASGPASFAHTAPGSMRGMTAVIMVCSRLTVPQLVM